MSSNALVHKTIINIDSSINKKTDLWVVEWMDGF